MNEAGRPSSPGFPDDVQDVLTFMFRDPAWVSKIVLGAVLGLIPILNFVTFGYALRVMHNVRDRSEPVLPQWGEDFGKFFMDGLVMAIIAFIYSLPGVIVGMVFGAIIGAGSNSTSSGANAAVTLASIVLFLFYLAYGAVLIFWLQGTYIKYSVEKRFGSAFEFQKIASIVQANLPRLALTVGLYAALSIALGILSFILLLIPCIGWLLLAAIGFVSGFYLLLILAYNCGMARNI